MTVIREVNRQLFEACKAGDFSLVTVLLKQGASIKVRDYDGNTPLHWTAMYGHVKVASLLVAKGAKVNTRNHFGETPLHRAAISNRPEMVRFLIEHRARVNPMTNVGNTPTMLALNHGHLRTSNLLIEFGGIH